jgi:glycosyltransferase involved in cell wall biosynthesis
VQRSKGELMIAKNMYVASRSGWLSDRSICYLASGRPVVAQDTGIAELYPVGDGLLTFGDPAQAAGALEEVSSDYARHSRAARALAEEHFEAGAVLRRLLGELGVG